MNAFHQLAILLRNALLVTLAVVVGFRLSDALGLPGGLQVICLIPAGYLLVRLSGDPIPPLKQWVPFAIAITGFLILEPLVMEAVRTHYPSIKDSSWPFNLINLVGFMAMMWLATLLESHWPFRSDEASTETDAP